MQSLKRDQDNNSTSGSAALAAASMHTATRSSERMCCTHRSFGWAGEVEFANAHAGADPRGRDAKGQVLHRNLAFFFTFASLRLVFMLWLRLFSLTFWWCLCGEGVGQPEPLQKWQT